MIEGDEMLHRIARRVEREFYQACQDETSWEARVWPVVAHEGSGRVELTAQVTGQPRGETGPVFKVYIREEVPQ